MPAWVLRLLVLTLLLAPLVTVLDGLARARRRRLAVGRWTLWALSCALPFLSCAVLAYLLGWRGRPRRDARRGGAAGGAAVRRAGGDRRGGARAHLRACRGCCERCSIRRLGSDVRPDPEVAGLALLLVLLGSRAARMVRQPADGAAGAAGAHLWLALADPDRLDIGRLPRRAVSLALVVLGAAPLLLLVLFYARQLDLGAGDVAWMGVLLLAAGHVSLFGAILWSVALGCLAAAALVALDVLPAPAGVPSAKPAEVTIRGPLSYAGPGSLGGTESALRR